MQNGIAHNTNHGPAVYIDKLCKGFGSPFFLGSRVSRAINQEQAKHTALNEANALNKIHRKQSLGNFKDWQLGI